ncbi:hypothetical protein K3X41_09255 [Aliiroseovarius crassostreae]|uniref:hypothetical protein n=1 Tax=Aliiroseovarius crassostreae TaxID=154981 RepID=UPI00220AD014|nr:hypothetical protein [Aliiroseovarius crassostreae]UWQ07014.1 hypothetical protein K3X25_09390 [Aliiroseovarius crassostreae]UWQ10122.1 hypothetical protein K3X41_09255 [Aliiroseovarius crassostreae]
MVKSEYFPTSALLCQSLSGEIGLSQLGHLLPDLQDHPVPPGGYDALIDLSGVTDIDCSFTGMATLVRARKARQETHRPPNRIAIWAPGDLAFGTCRMLEQLAQGELVLDLAVMREEEEALAFLLRSERRLETLRDHLERAERNASAASA